MNAEQGKAPIAKSEQSKAPIAKSEQGKAPIAKSEQGKAPIAKSEQGKAPIAIPAWLRTANAKAGIGSKDVKIIFNLTGTQLDRAIKAGEFPQPDMRSEGHNLRHQQLRMWHPRTILNEIIRRNKVAA